MGNKMLNKGDYQKASLGQYGSRDVTTAGPTAATEIYHCIIPQEESVVTACTDDAGGPSTSLAGKTLAAGIPVYGRFHTVGVSSGWLKCYLEG